MKLYTIDTELFKLDGGAMFGVVPKNIWNKSNPADENNLCSWAMRLLLIEEGNRLMLVDAGIGDKQDAKFFGHYHLHGGHTLKTSLDALGFGLDDITDVFLTHLHFDHVGGAIKREGDKLIPTFKNATFWSNKEHWEWAINPNDREKASFLKENILPLQESGQLKFTNDGFDAFDIHIANGHTESQMLPKIQYKGRTLVYMADLLPSTGHLPMPYVMAYDMFPLTTLKEKKAFLTEAVENDYVLFFEHDPVNECCTLQMTEKGIRVKETFKLSEL